MLLTTTIHYCVENSSVALFAAFLTMAAITSPTIWRKKKKRKTIRVDGVEKWRERERERTYAQ